MKDSSELEEVPRQIGSSHKKEPVRIFTDTNNKFKLKAYEIFFREFLPQSVEFECISVLDDPRWKKCKVDVKGEPFEERGIRSHVMCRVFNLVHAFSKEILSTDFVISTKKGLHIDYEAKRGYLIAATALWHRNVRNVAPSGYIPLPDHFVEELIKIVPYVSKKRCIGRKEEKGINELTQRYCGNEVAEREVSFCEYLYPHLQEPLWLAEGARYASVPFGPKSLAYFFVPPPTPKKDKNPALL